MEIFLQKDGRPQGPFAVSELERLFQEGRLGGSELAWREGLPGWIPLREIDPALKRRATTSAGRTTLPKWARYVVRRTLVEGEASSLYLVEDPASGQLWAIRLIKLAPSDPLRALLKNQLEAMILHRHPCILPVTSYQSGLEGIEYARAWAEGFSLMDLLKVRGRLSMTEVLRLLEGLPEAFDHVHQHGFPLARAELRKLFVIPTTPERDWESRRQSSVLDWPPFRLRWNAVSVRLAAEEGATVTQVDAGTLPTSEDPCFALAQLVRELLGARGGAATPISALSDAGNVVLRQALTRGPKAPGSAADFWRELATGASSDLRPAPARSAPPSVLSAPSCQICHSRQQVRRLGRELANLWGVWPAGAGSGSFLCRRHRRREQKARAACLVGALLFGLAAGAWCLDWV